MHPLRGATKVNVKGSDYVDKGDYQATLVSFLETCKAGNYNYKTLNFNRKDISGITNRYNVCMNQSVYQYIPEKNKLYWGVKAGYYPVKLKLNEFYGSNQEKVNGTALQLGLFVSDQIGDIDKKLFAQGDIQYLHLSFSNTLDSDVKTNIVLLPLTFKYLLLPRQFSPYLLAGAFLGINLSHTSSAKNFNENNINSNDSGLTYGGGVRYTVNEHEFSLEFRHQQFSLNGSGSNYSFLINSNAITVAFGFQKHH